jgi:L-Lysine epsilon oxidase N-terminal/L-lysine epsilon oxidase C-terminal domain
VIYKIHPAIGIARLGDSEKFYLAPATVGGLPVNLDGRRFKECDFRDSKKKLKRQGVRFQVLAYNDDGSGPGVPVIPGKNGVATIRWTVHVANKKAIWYQFMTTAGEQGYGPDHPLRNPTKIDPKQRLKLVIDPGPRTLAGPNRRAAFSRTTRTPYKMTFPEGNLQPADLSIDSLGEIHTDAVSRLTFVGGHGISGSPAPEPVIVNFANNDNWWDDTCDGPVTATVIMNDKRPCEAVSSWVIVAPPRYAPQLVNLVTLYDVIFDTSVRFLGFRPGIYKNSIWNKDFKPSWQRDIQPIIERAHNYHWVVAVPPKPHQFDWIRLGNPDPAFNPYRKYYLNVVRPPNAPNLFASLDTGLPMMPYLCGDNCVDSDFTTSNYLTLTKTQYFYLQQWADGNFTATDAREEGEGEKRDRVALENCAGGGFSPGIEMTWISRNPVIYDQPFRILRKRAVGRHLSLGGDLESGLEPGDVSKYMALPWQADFNECSTEKIGDRFVWWWPVERPTFVYFREKQVPWVGRDLDQNALDYVAFSDDLDMVKKWHELGFLFKKGRRDAKFVEVARKFPREDTDPMPNVR